MKGIIVTGCYLALAGVAIAYELSIRIYDTGNSEFAGMLSFLLTLPASLIVSFIAGRGFGTSGSLLRVVKRFGQMTELVGLRRWKLYYPFLG